MNQGLTKFTEVPINKWLPLLHLELIKEKNKPRNRDNILVKVPFFLDVENKEEAKKQYQDEVKSTKQEQSRILKANQHKLLDELGGDLEIFLQNNNNLPH